MLRVDGILNTLVQRRSVHLQLQDVIENVHDQLQNMHG